MIHIEEELCTGCGLCVPVCTRGAMRLTGNTAAIDPSLCTSCARCVDVCLTGAIISTAATLELASVSAPAKPVEANLAPATNLPPQMDMWAVIEKIFSGLFAIAGYALDRQHRRSKWLPAVSSRAEISTLSGRGTALACRRRTYGQRAGQGLGYGGRRTGRAQTRRRNRVIQTERSVR